MIINRLPTKQQRFQICEAKTDRPKRKNRQIHNPIAEDFNSLLSTADRTSQKVSKYPGGLNSINNQQYPIKIYTTFQPTTARHLPR